MPLTLVPPPQVSFKQQTDKVEASKEHVEMKGERKGVRCEREEKAREEAMRIASLVEKGYSFYLD